MTAGLRWRLLGNPWEGAIYLGMVSLVLLAWFLVQGKAAAPRTKAFVVAGMLVFAIFARGEWLLLLGRRIVPMSDMLLSHLPLFSNVRTPARAAVFVGLFMAIGVGFAVAAAWRAARGWRSGAAFAGLALLLALDLAPAGLEMSPITCPAGYGLITADKDQDFGVLDLPIDQYRDLNAAMSFQSCHGRPLASGVVSRVVSPALLDRLIVGDPVAQRLQLAEARVKYIVIHPQKGVQFRWLGLSEGPIESYVATYRTVYADTDSTVLQVYP